jgi:hypothetical protein
MRQAIPLASAAAAPRYAIAPEWARSQADADRRVRASQELIDAQRLAGR